MTWLEAGGELPVPGIYGVPEVRRTAGLNGTRPSAMLGDDVVGYIEVEILDDGRRPSRNGVVGLMSAHMTGAPQHRRFPRLALASEPGWRRRPGTNSDPLASRGEGRDELAIGRRSVPVILWQ